MNNVATRTILLTFALGLGAGLVSPSCATGDSETLPEPDDAEPRAAEGPTQRVHAPPSPATRNVEKKHEKLVESLRSPMPDAKEAFAEIAELIEADYVDGPLSEDALWTAAIDGVMSHLIQHGDHPINTLMSPEEVAELKIGTSGQLVGIGVMIERVADVVVIRGAIPGGPAEAAGLQAGDRILGVDDQRLKDMSLREVVDLIRGKEGSSVELFVQRDTEEWTASLIRGTIAVRNVETTMLSDDLGYLRIRGFAENTTAEFDDAMAALAEEGMQRMILDLRGCPGGMLESALDVSERLLPAGLRVVSMKSRDGEVEHLETESEDPWESLPLVVLTGPHTASGAEILAEALSHHERARVVGEPTFGKGTVERVHELSHGWAVKLSVSRFLGPDGAPNLGVGVRPDLLVPGDEATKKHVPVADLDPDADHQLSAAMELLED